MENWEYITDAEITVHKGMYKITSILSNAR